MALQVGFLGMGIMGEPMARNVKLSQKYSSVTVWNRSAGKCDKLVAEGLKQASTPAELVSQCDITFAMLSDPEAALEVVTGPGGVLEGISSGKGYVDMSTVDQETSGKISQLVREKGGRFLEAPVSGSKKPAIDGTLIILAAGDRTLYDEAMPGFEAMGKKSYFLGDVGAGANMKLVVNMIMGGMMGALCEGIALADKAGLDKAELLDVLSQGAISNPMFSLKGPQIAKETFPTAFPLKHQQKDMRLAIALGDKLDQPVPVAAAANEEFKAAKAMGAGDEDFAAVYKAIKK